MDEEGREEDRKLVCVEKDCGREFTFTMRDQKFYKRNGYPDPKRCHSCRPIARARYDKLHGTDSTAERRPH